MIAVVILILVLVVLALDLAHLDLGLPMVYVVQCLPMVYVVQCLSAVFRFAFPSILALVVIEKRIPAGWFVPVSLAIHHLLFLCPFLRRCWVADLHLGFVVLSAGCVASCP